MLSSRCFCNTSSHYMIHKPGQKRWSYGPYYKCTILITKLLALWTLLYIVHYNHSFLIWKIHLLPMENDWQAVNCFILLFLQHKFTLQIYKPGQNWWSYGPYYKCTLLDHSYYQGTGFMDTTIYNHSFLIWKNVINTFASYGKWLTGSYCFILWKCIIRFLAFCFANI